MALFRKEYKTFEDWLKNFAEGIGSGITLFARGLTWGDAQGIERFA